MLLPYGSIQFDANLTKEKKDVFGIANDIQSLSHFKRNTSEVMKQLKESGNPVVLTVNGKAEVNAAWLGSVSL